jgi:integrase
MNPTQTAEERFWGRVTQGKGCWEWTGARDSTGYGGVSVKGKILRAHRYAWELTNGPIPEGSKVRQTCDNRACCRPDHLTLSTAEPPTDALARAERTRLEHAIGKGHLERRGPHWRLVAYNPAVSGYERRPFRGTEDEAKIALAELVAELGVEGIAYDKTPRTFGEALDAFLLVKKEEGLEETTLYTYENILRRVDTKRRTLPVDKVTTPILEALARDLLAGKGPSGRTISRRQARVTMSLIEAALDGEKRAKRIRSNPAVEVKLPPIKKDKARRRKPSPAPAAGFRRVLELAEERYGYDFLVFLGVAAAAGGRRGEVVGLKWDRIFWAQNRIELADNVVRVKGGWKVKALPKDDEARFMDVGVGTMKMLQRLHDERVARAEELDWVVLPDGFVFSDWPDGRTPWVPQTALRRFQALCEEAGLGSNRRIHDLRAMFATELVNAGYSPQLVAELLGHEDIATAVVAMRHYIGSTPQPVKELAAATLDEILYGANLT